jgi:hypothetical protein
MRYIIGKFITIVCLVGMASYASAAAWQDVKQESGPVAPKPDAYLDEDPKLITLPPGKYVIVPETNMTKTEIVGVILEPGQLTEVHMMGG